MITFALERFGEVIKELEPLLQRHYAEISTHAQHGVPLAPIYESYVDQEAKGALLMLIGREAGVIVGYVVCFVQPGLHYRTCLTCTPDIFYVRPDKRNGSVGVKMFRALEAILRQRGVQRWAIGCKLDHDASRLFAYLGFKPVETIYEKWLDPEGE